MRSPFLSYFVRDASEMKEINGRAPLEQVVQTVSRSLFLAGPEWVASLEAHMMYWTLAFVADYGRHRQLFSGSRPSHVNSFCLPSDEAKLC